MPNRINKRDLFWVILIGVSFIFALAVSWERWGNPLVDCGREMNQPLRLAEGEMLYSDVRHIYGPLSPYLNALLYKIFGPSLAALQASGIASAIIILALVYWISRRLMNRAASAAATLSVMWLCAFKQAGNYILPYSYSALHGCALGLIALALLVKAAASKPGSVARGQGSGRSKRFIPGISNAEPEMSDNQSLTPDSRPLIPSYWLAAAGLVAGLTVLAKTEMGLAAMTAGVVASALIGYPKARSALALVAVFVLPALVVVVAVYWQIAERVGWQTLSRDSFLFLRNLPPELVYFNKRVSGFDLPAQSLAQMVGAAVRVGALALIIASISLLVTRNRKEQSSEPRELALPTSSDAGRASYQQIWMLLALSLAVFILIPVAEVMNWDKGPYLAMPLMIIGLLIVALITYQKQISKRGGANPKLIVLIVVGAYALASLARVILRVRSGGAYSSYLLPASVMLFTYLWAHPFAAMFRSGRTRRVARNIAIGLILADVVATAALLGYRYRTRNTYPITTNRGTIIALPDLGQAMDEAIAFINQETTPGEPVAVIPEGTSLNFFTDRPNPLREEITTPGFLDDEGEQRAIRQLSESNTRFVFVTNRATPEFGPAIFGRDYCEQLMAWIEANFEQVAVFGPDQNPDLQIGDSTFFIRAYRKRQLARSERFQVIEAVVDGPSDRR